MDHLVYFFPLDITCYFKLSFQKVLNDLAQNWFYIKGRNRCPRVSISTLTNRLWPPSIAQRLPRAVVNWETAQVRIFSVIFLLFLRYYQKQDYSCPLREEALGGWGSTRRMGEHPVSCLSLKNLYRCNEWNSLGALLVIDNHLKRFKCNGFTNWPQLRSLALGSSVCVTGPHLGACHYRSLLATVNNSWLMHSHICSYFFFVRKDTHCPLILMKFKSILQQFLVQKASVKGQWLVPYHRLKRNIQT